MPDECKGYNFGTLVSALGPRPKIMVKSDGTDFSLVYCMIVLKNVCKSVQKSTFNHF